MIEESAVPYSKEQTSEIGLVSAAAISWYPITRISCPRSVSCCECLNSNSETREQWSSVVAGMQVRVIMVEYFLTTSSGMHVEEEIWGDIRM